MGIMLGNLNVSQIEDRIGLKFPNDIRKFMEENNQQEAANIKSGKWHCFDIPFTIVCGDAETATKIFESVKDKASEVKEPLYFAICE